MRARSAGYWTTTILVALAFVSGGFAYLARAEAPLRGLAELGYPAYFPAILGLWKLLGGLAILAPRLPRVKEWAYAGIAFDLTGAAASQAAVGAHVAHVVAPLVLLALAAASWALRPPGRVLAGAAQATARREPIGEADPRLAARP